MGEEGLAIDRRAEYEGCGEGVEDSADRAVAKHAAEHSAGAYFDPKIHVAAGRGDGIGEAYRRRYLAAQQIAQVRIGRQRLAGDG